MITCTIICAYCGEQFQGDGVTKDIADNITKAKFHQHTPTCPCKPTSQVEELRFAMDFLLEENYN